MQRIITSLAIISAICLGILASGSAPALATSSQPDMSCISDVSVAPLALGKPSATSDMDLMLLRITFAPGGGIGAHSHPGSLVLSIESGELEFELMEGEVTVQRATTDGTPGTVETMQPGDTVTLQPGDSLAEDELIHAANNTGDEPTVVLVSALMTTGEPFVQCVEGA
jgi:quercetin dioxygenase-like cupin family protein